MIDFWYKVRATDTSQAIFVRCTANGTVSIAVNGQTFSALADTTVNDGTVIIDVTGLTDKKVPWTLSFDGSVYGEYSGDKGLSGWPKTPAKIAYGSCEDERSVLHVGYQAVKQGACCFCFIGDTPYTVLTRTAWGESTTNAGQVTTTDNFNAYSRRFRKNPGFQYVGHRIPCFFMADDHDYWPGDNWDHSLDNANSNAGGEAVQPPVTTQAEVDAIWLIGNASRRIYHAGNPINTDSDAATQKPPASTLTDADYPVNYFRTQIGDVEIFVPDLISHMDNVRTAASATKTRLGTTQKAWLLNHLAQSAATYKVILSSKKTFANTLDNTDTWAAVGVNLGFENERDEILSSIHAASSWAVSGGVVWGTGDRHCPAVHAQESPDHVAVNACPMGQNKHEGGDFTATTRWIGVRPNTGLLLNPNKSESALLGGQNVFGMFEDQGGKIKCRIVTTQGWDYWYGYVNAGENKLSYPKPKIAIG